MKKNIFSVIITALTVINVVLTAVMFFVMLPTFQKTNTLITQVASVLNLELDGDAAADPDANYSFQDDYDDISKMLTEDQTQITGIITNVIQSHTSEDGEQAVIEKEALEKIQELLDSKVAVKLNLNGYVRQ